MPNVVIKQRRTLTPNYVWQPEDLADGQLGINLADGTIHFKDINGAIVDVSSTKPLVTQVDKISQSEIYRGWAVDGALTSDGVWRVEKYVLTSGVWQRLHPNGVDSYAYVWDDHTTFTYT